MEATSVPDLVRLLLIHEAGEAGVSRDQQAIIKAAESACEKLRVHLSKLVGRDGFRTLLVRAVALATAQFPHLSALRVGANGALEGLSDKTAEATAEGAVALVAQLFGLLVTFIGEDLTLRIFSTIWPTFHLDDAAAAAGNPSNTLGREQKKL